MTKVQRIPTVYNRSLVEANTIFMGPEKSSDWPGTTRKVWIKAIEEWFVDKIGMDKSHFIVVFCEDELSFKHKFKVQFVGEGIVMAKLHGMIK